MTTLHLLWPPPLVSLHSLLACMTMDCISYSCTTSYRRVETVLKYHLCPVCHSPYLDRVIVFHAAAALFFDVTCFCGVSFSVYSHQMKIMILKRQQQGVFWQHSVRISPQTNFHLLCVRADLILAFLEIGRELGHRFQRNAIYIWKFL